MIDASVAIAWCFDDEKTPLSEAALDQIANDTVARVPAIWPFEVANAMLSAERSHRIKIAQVAAFLQRLESLPVLVEPPAMGRTFSQILALARQQNLTQYDAAYLELAVRESIPLITLDKALRRAASILGIRTEAARS